MAQVIDFPLLPHKAEPVEGAQPEGELIAITGKGTLPAEIAKQLLALVEEGEVAAVAVVYMTPRKTVHHGFSMMPTERGVFLGDSLLQKARNVLV